MVVVSMDGFATRIENAFSARTLKQIRHNGFRELLMKPLVVSEFLQNLPFVWLAILASNQGYSRTYKVAENDGVVSMLA
jgi:hypothetical protein